MVRIKHIHSEAFTIVDNKFIREERLSWKARGIFLYLYAQADDWNFYEAEVALHATDGKDSLHSGLQELERLGYLRRVRGRKEQGKFANMIWELTMEPEGNVEDTTKSRKVTRLPVTTKQIDTTMEIVTPPVAEKVGAEDASDTKSAHQVIIDHLNKQTGRRYNARTKATVALINERLSEGYQVADFIKVIDTKVQHWLHDDKFNGYLRPETLFSARFDGYVNEAPRRVKTVNNAMQEAWYE